MYICKYLPVMVDSNIIICCCIKDDNNVHLHTYIHTYIFINKTNDVKIFSGENESG